MSGHLSGRVETVASLDESHCGWSVDSAIASLCASARQYASRRVYRISDERLRKSPLIYCHTCHRCQWQIMVFISN